MSFPTTVNALQAPAVQGDFASQNPFASVLAGAGQLVVPPAPAIINVGHFTFVNPTTGPSRRRTPADSKLVSWVATSKGSSPRTSGRTTFRSSPGSC